MLSRILNYFVHIAVQFFQRRARIAAMVVKLHAHAGEDNAHQNLESYTRIEPEISSLEENF